MGMHPGSRRSGTNNSLFLEYPYIFRIIQSGKKDVSQFLPQTKYCALTNVKVNYTPDNVLSLTPNNFVSAVSLTLTFSEMTTLTRQDIHEIEDTATPEEFAWIETQKASVVQNSEFNRRRQRNLRRQSGETNVQNQKDDFNFLKTKPITGRRRRRR